LQHMLLESAAVKKNQEFGEKDLSSEPLSRHQKQQDQEQEASNKQLSMLERLEVKMERLEMKIDEMRVANARQEMKLDEQKQVNEEIDASKKLEEMDSLWWQMRVQFDRYLDAADGQVKSFKAALKALHAYTSECTANFAGIKDAFAASARVERQTHAVLKEVWTTVLPLVGVLTAKIEDNADLLLFAQADVRTVDVSESFGLNMSFRREKFCTERDKQKAVAEKVVRAAVQKGICGQAFRQLEVLFEHLVMLEDRFIFGNLGKAPTTEALTEAATRLKVAKESVHEAIPALAEGLMRRAVGFCR